ncbi:acylneuraminate cytidylyltransferase [Rathayibacter sp. YIM 133350]|uniref:acylneuraminate cytidylyltransferase n=1 Tax=Rathayibacter sp. YIM 133350 TaxID=3131992 RepID=UPI00307F4C0F
MPDAQSLRVAPNVVAVIPARGGSKGLPRKNLERVGGIPLVARAVQAARAAASVDVVVVSTDSPAIAQLARQAGALVVDRPPHLAGDTASSESAVLHALDELGVDPDVTILVQATSPFIDPADLDAAVARVRDGEVDSVLSAAPSHVFLWRAGEGGVTGVNHDSAVRQRRQDREPEYRETGAFYVMRTILLRRSGGRFAGRIGVQLVSAAHAIEIDDAADLDQARVLAATAQSSGERRVDVDALVTDFDGVHTDDTAVLQQDGTESVRVSRSDGHGVRMLRETGMPILILSAETNPVVAARAAKLQVECLHGVHDKASALRAWAQSTGVALDRIAYLGNDLADLPCLRIVGWPVAVADAHPAVRTAARITLSRRGGEGAVRELAELILGVDATAGEPASTQEDSWQYASASR